MSRLAGSVLALILAFPLFAADPADPLIAQGEAALHAGNVDTAIDLFKQAIAKSPKNAAAHYHLGDAYGDAALKAGLFSQMSLANKCKDEFLAAVALDPNYYEARLGLLEWYLQVPGIAGGSEAKAIGDLPVPISEEKPVFVAMSFTQLPRRVAISHLGQEKWATPLVLL